MPGNEVVNGESLLFSWGSPPEIPTENPQKNYVDPKNLLLRFLGRKTAWFVCICLLIGAGCPSFRGVYTLTGAL